MLQNSTSTGAGVVGGRTGEIITLSGAVLAMIGGTLGVVNARNNHVVSVESLY